MVFSSVSFLFIFLPTVLIVYYLVPRKWVSCKNAVLLAASLLFYFYGEQLLVFVMLLSAGLDYVWALVIERYRQNKYVPKIALALSIAGSIAILGYFKYAGFFVGNFSRLFGLDEVVLSIALPIGISFYTFQTMSYTIDVYRGGIKAQKNPLAYATYVAMFPQLVAGPIVRYTEVSGELASRVNTFADFSAGVKRFVIGLSKKVLIANTFAGLAQAITYSSESTVLFYWMSAAAFFFQVYFDFSGYSDMAIGLGKMFGFHFPENFNYPYTAKSVTEFWRRWHMTLGRWFRDYVYIPLGGNRVSKLKWVRNVVIVWFLTGFWHGANWNFIVWGLYFAVFLILEKLVFKSALKKMPSFLARFYTLAVVFIGFVLFNADSLPEAIGNLSAMFGGAGLKLSGAEALYYLRSFAFLFVIAIVAATPVVPNLIAKLRKKTAAQKVFNAMEPVVLVALLLWTAGFLVDGSFNPFLYFRF